MYYVCLKYAYDVQFSGGELAFFLRALRDLGVQFS